MNNLKAIIIAGSLLCSIWVLYSTAIFHLKAGGQDCTDFNAEVEQQVLGLSEITDMAVSPDGNMLGIATDDQLILYDTRTLRVVREIEADTVGFTFKLSFSPDGMYVASGVDRVGVWNVSTGDLQMILEGNTELGNTSMRDLAWSSDEQFLAGIGTSGLHIWDTTTGLQVRILYEQKSIYSSEVDPYMQLAWSADGSVLILADRTAIYTWDFMTEEEQELVASHESGIITNLVRSPNDSLLALANDTTRTIELWNTENWTVSHRLEQVPGNLLDLEWSPDGSNLALGVRNTPGCTLFTWQVEPFTSEPIAVGVHPRWVRYVAWSADSESLFSATLDGTIYKWDVSSGNLLGVITSAEETE